MYKLFTDKFNRQYVQQTMPDQSIMIIPLEGDGYEQSAEYHKYRAWRLAGNTPDAETPVARSMSAEERGCRLFLKLTDPIDQVDIDEKQSILDELNARS